MKRKKLNFKNVKYGQLVEVIQDSGYNAGMKIHFFNLKGVLLGNVYEFVPYNKIRIRPDGCVWEGKYYMKRFEKIRQFVYEVNCRIITVLIRWTQYN